MKSELHWKKLHLNTTAKKLGERLARLVGGVAVIKVGGMTEIEVKEKKIASTMRFLQHVRLSPKVSFRAAELLWRARDALGGKFTAGMNVDQIAGVGVVNEALSAPMIQIANNAGISGEVVADRVLSSKDYNHGYNAQTGEYGDMLKMGIIDPTKVVKIALQSAASVAGAVLTTGAVLSEIPEERPAPAMGGGMPGMM